MAPLTSTVLWRVDRPALLPFRCSRLLSNPTGTNDSAQCGDSSTQWDNQRPVENESQMSTVFLWSLGQSILIVLIGFSKDWRQSLTCWTALCAHTLLLSFPPPLTSLLSPAPTPAPVNASPRFGICSWKEPRLRVSSASEFLLLFSYFGSS